MDALQVQHLVMLRNRQPGEPRPPRLPTLASQPPLQLRRRQVTRVQQSDSPRGGLGKAVRKRLRSGAAVAGPLPLQLFVWPFWGMDPGSLAWSPAHQSLHQFGEFISFHEAPSTSVKPAQ